MKICRVCRLTLPATSFAFNGVRDNRKSICETCFKAQRRAYYEKTKETRLRRAREWKKNNPDKVKISKKKSAIKNKDTTAARNKAWVEANRQRNRDRINAWNIKNRAKKTAYCRKTRHKYPEKYRASYMRRKVAKIQAVPSWADHLAIEKIYKQAAELNYHVDHIVPLRSKYVCGLHWEANLQVLPPFDNISKGNRFWPDQGGYVESTSIRVTSASSKNC